MNIIEYEILRKNRNSKENDPFINEIISLMPKYVKEASTLERKKKYENILVKSDPVDFAIITVKGEISVVNEFESGKIYEPVVIYPNDFTAVVEIICGIKEIITLNIAKTDVEFIKIPKKVFLKWLDDSHLITRYVLNSVSNNFQQNMFVSGEGVLLDSMYLLVSHLLQNALLVNDLFILTETREKTSRRTGINLRTLYRHINKLKSSGYILKNTRKLSFSKEMQVLLYDYHKQLRNK